MEAHVHDHGDLGGLVAQGLSWAFITLLACVAIVLGILLLKHLIVKLSPRRLCNSCNRYYSLRKAACPFCGAAPEAADEVPKDQ